MKGLDRFIPRAVPLEEAARIERAITDRLLRNVGEGLASACFWAVIVGAIMAECQLTADRLFALVDSQRVGQRPL